MLDDKLDVIQHVELAAWKAKPILGCQRCAQQVKAGGSYPVIPYGEIPPRYCVQLCRFLLGPLKPREGRFQLDIWQHFFCDVGDESLAQVTQRSHC